MRVLLTPRGTCALPEMYLSGRLRLRKLEATRPPKTAVQTAAHVVWLDVEVALTRFLVALTKVAW